MGAPVRLAVLGSPIAHSRSPLLHAAAYRVLGLDWRYEARECTEERLAEVVADPEARWHGLSLTMPLKHAVRPLLADEDAVARATGAVNTVLIERPAGSPPTLHGYNTDVAGIVRALADAGVTGVDRVEVLGGGATAASAVAAAAELGAQRVTVTVRSPERAAGLAGVADALGVALSLRSFADWGAGGPHPLVVSTLPGSAAAGLDVPEAVRRSSTLFDVAYSPWPSPLGTRWAEVGSPVVSGLAMLVHQALVQVRVFVGGDPLLPLPDEAAVLGAMRASVSES